MKKWILIMGILVSMAGAVNAQKTPARQAGQKGKTAVLNKNATVKDTTALDGATVTRLNHTGSWSAYAGKSRQAQLSIADPTIHILNLRAQGTPTDVDMKDLLGVSKRRFGLANGHILLRINAATTAGTNTGSGAVGTGSSPAALGAIGPGMGVNGTSPAAGTGMNTFPVTIVPNDVITYPVVRKPINGAPDK